MSSEICAPGILILILILPTFFISAMISLGSLLLVVFMLQVNLRLLGLIWGFEVQTNQGKSGGSKKEVLSRMSRRESLCKAWSPVSRPYCWPCCPGSWSRRSHARSAS